MTWMDRVPRWLVPCHSIDYPYMELVQLTYMYMYCMYMYVYIYVGLHFTYINRSKGTAKPEACDRSFVLIVAFGEKLSVVIHSFFGMKVFTNIAMISCDNLQKCLFSLYICLNIHCIKTSKFVEYQR